MRSEGGALGAPELWPHQGGKEGLELELRFCQLSIRVRAGDDAVARVQGGAPARNAGAAQPQHPLAVTPAVNPAHWPCVATPIETLVIPLPAQRGANG